MSSENSSELNGEKLPRFVPEIKYPIRGEGQIKLEIFAQLVGSVGNRCNGSLPITHKDLLRLFRSFNDLFYESPSMGLIIDEVDKRLTTVASQLGVQILFLPDVHDPEMQERGGKGLV